MEKPNNGFLDKIKELYPLYDRVKKCIIYAEEFDPKHEFFLAPMNELRSSLDHIFKAAEHDDDLDYEINEVKEHLDRAGYDAFELLSINLQDSITKKLFDYSTDTLSQVFPEYYHEIRPKLVEIRSSIAEIRKRKKYSKNGSNEAFGSYFDHVSILMKYNQQVENIIPALEEFKQKKLKEEFEKEMLERKIRIKERIFNAVIIGIGSAVASGILVYFLTSYFIKNSTP